MAVRLPVHERRAVGSLGSGAGALPAGGTDDGAGDAQVLHERSLRGRVLWVDFRRPLCVCRALLRADHGHVFLAAGAGMTPALPFRIVERHADLHPHEGGQISLLGVMAAAVFASLLLLVINTGVATSS